MTEESRVWRSELTPLAFLERSANVFRGRTAVIDGDRQYSYGPHTVCAWHPEWDTLPLEQRVRLKARQGVAYVIADPIRVVDENMRDVPADGQTLGEVVMRGNNVMKGYYRDPEATAKAFKGGWFHSGDLKVPRYVEFGELPKTSTGKIQKCVLRNREWAGQEKKIH